MRLIHYLSGIDSLSFELPGYYRRNIDTGGDSLLIPLIKRKSIASDAVSNKRDCRLTLIGATKELLNPSLGCFENSVYEVALLMQNKKRKIGRLKNVSYFIAKNGVNSAPFWIRIYKNDNGKPGEELSVENLIVTPIKSNSYNRYDISRHEIVFPENGCFVSMQWLNTRDIKYLYKTNRTNDEAFGQNLVLTDELENALCYQRENKYSWTRIEKFQWDGITLNKYAPMISIEVCY